MPLGLYFGDMNNIPKTNPHNAKVRQLDYNSDEQLNEAMKGIDILNTPCWTQYTFILI